MTAKEKAKELVMKFANFVKVKDFWGDDIKFQNAKICSILAVDDIIEALEITISRLTLRMLDKHQCLKDLQYWQKVKKEIEKNEYTY